jgi:hypothetical protein
VVKFLELLSEIIVIPPGWEYRDAFKFNELPDTEFRIFKSLPKKEGFGLADEIRISKREVSGNTEIPTLLKHSRHPDAQRLIELLDLLPVSFTETTRRYALNLKEGSASFYFKSKVFLEYESPYSHTDQPTPVFFVSLGPTDTLDKFPDARPRILDSTGSTGPEVLKSYDIETLLQLFKDNPEEFYEKLGID